MSPEGCGGGGGAGFPHVLRNITEALSAPYFHGRSASADRDRCASAAVAAAGFIFVAGLFFGRTAYVADIL